MKLISVHVLSIDCNESVSQKLPLPLRDIYYISFFTEDDSDPSAEQKRKYAAATNLGAESDFAALDSNFCWLGDSTTFQTISNKSFGYSLKYFS